MRKRPSSEREEVLSKKQKNEFPIVLKRNKEIYSKSFKNTYRSFSTEFPTDALCLHPTKQLIAVYGIPILPSWQVNGYILIYTIEGYLVTKFKVQEWAYDVTNTKIYFSDHLIIAFFTGRGKSVLIRYNGYNNVKYSVVPGPCIFDCGENEYLYLWEKGNNRINIYSHDFQKIRTFTAYKYGTPIVLKIRGDTMVVLSEQSTKKISSAKRPCANITILRFSITNDKLLGFIKFDEESFKFPQYMCLDPLSNVLIANHYSIKIAVWYRGGQLRYYNTLEPYCTTLGGLEMTEDFQMIRTMCDYPDHEIRVSMFEHSH